MDAEAARAVLAQIAQEAGSGTLLWRGGHLDGSDLDLLVRPEAEAKLGSTLTRASLLPRLAPDGRVLWSTADGSKVIVDVLPERRWPGHYPSVAGVRARAVGRTEAPPVASAGDRLLVLASDAVAGRPVGALARRARILLAESGARADLDMTAATERMMPLAALIGDPDALESAARRGRLPYSRALTLAARSTPARRALGARISARVRALGPRRAGHRRYRGRLIALSGMDGAGKSTHAAALSHHLSDRGISVHPTIVRIGREPSALDRIRIPLKRFLRTGGLSDPVATSPETADPDALPSERPSGRLAWCWAIVVAAENVRTGRRIARVRRRGVTVVSDRWLADHLVDFESRYGRHSLARALLRAGMPRLDLGILLDIDPATSFARKPGDQAPGVLRLMQRGYAALVPDLDLVAIDGTAPHEQVRAAVLALGESVTENRSGRLRR